VPHLAPFAAESLGSNDASPHDHRDLLVVVAEELLSPLMAGPDDERDSDDVAASFVRRNDARAAAQPKRTRLSSRAVGLAVAFNAAFSGSVSLHPDAVRRNARSLALRALQDVAPLLLAKTKIALHARAIIGVAGPDFDSALHVAVAECIVRELVAHMCASYVRDAVRRSTSLTQDGRDRQALRSTLSAVSKPRSDLASAAAMKSQGSATEAPRDPSPSSRMRTRGVAQAEEMPAVSSPLGSRSGGSGPGISPTKKKGKKVT